MQLLFPYIAHNSVAFICVKAIYIYGHEFLVVTKKVVTWLESPSLKITVQLNYHSKHFYDFLHLCYLCDHSDANSFCYQWKKPKMWVYLFFPIQNLLLHICKISTGYTKISKFLTYKEIKEMNVIIIRKYAQWVGICNNPSKGRKTWPWKPITNFVPG